MDALTSYNWCKVRVVNLLTHENLGTSIKQLGGLFDCHLTVDETASNPGWHIQSNTALVAINSPHLAVIGFGPSSEVVANYHLGPNLLLARRFQAAICRQRNCDRLTLSLVSCLHK